MGIYDREYARRAGEPSNLFQSMRTWSVSTWIAIALLAAFLANDVTRRPENLLTGSLYHACTFAVPQAIGHLQLWRFATFQFVQQGMWLLIFNFVAVIACGPMVEQYMGGRRFVLFYLACGLAPVVPFIVGWYTGAVHELLPPEELAHVPAAMAAIFQPHLAGASGATLGILLFAAIRTGADSCVELPGFTPIAVDPRLIAWILFGVVAWFTCAISGLPFDSSVSRELLPQNACYFAGVALSAGAISRSHIAGLFPRRRRRVYSRVRR